MSSSPTGVTSTTVSSSSWPSGADAADGPTGSRTALVACGALAQPAAAIASAVDWPVDVYPLPPLLHNSPAEIAPRVRALVEQLVPSYARVAVGYADCGTYGALDVVCGELGVERMAGLHCYDVYAGAELIERLMAEEPGTYLVTDFLVRSFARTVERELGLDRWPELRDEYFRHYRRVVWLAQEPDDDDLRRLAGEAATRLGLPLTVLPTGQVGLVSCMATLVSG